MSSTLRIRTSLARVVTRAAVVGALILGVAPVLAQAAGPATPLAEPITEFVPEQTPVLEAPPVERAPAAAQAPAAPPAADIPPAEPPVTEAPPAAPPETAAPPATPPETTAPPAAEAPAPPATEEPAPPVTVPTTPVAVVPAPAPPVTEAQTPPAQPKPATPASPPTEATPTGGTTTSGPATPKEISTPPVDEAVAVPLPAPGVNPGSPVVDAGAPPKAADPAKRLDTIKTAVPTELISATSILPQLTATAPTATGRDTAVEATTGATARTAVRVARGDEMPASTMRSQEAAPFGTAPSPATPARAAPFARPPIAADGFRLATPLKPDLREVGARSPNVVGPLPTRAATDEPRTAITEDVFSSRVEAPMSAVVGGSSFLAVLASYALPGTGPVPMSLALVMFAQLAIMLGMMRAPRVHLSERLVIVGLLAGDAGHSRAVQRPG